MPRHARLKGEFCTYHVMLRGNNKGIIFNNDEDKLRFLEILGKTRNKYNFLVHSYCLMNNHVHLLLGDNGNNISQIMKSLSVSFVMYYNRRYERSGHLFQDRYLSQLVTNDAYLLEASRYIHNNPVKAGIAYKPQHYRWSSYNIYLGAAKDTFGIVEMERILQYISNDRQKAIKEYQSFVNREEVGSHQFIDIDDEKGTVDKQEFIWTISQAEERILQLLNKQSLSLGELLREKTLRDQAVREIRENSALTLKDLGKLFGGLSESRISRIIGGSRG